MSPERAKIVLVVDDDEGILKFMGEWLRRRGYEPLLAASALDGLRHAREAKPSLALLDVHLPDTNGFDLIKLFQADAVTRDIPVIFMSALPHKDVMKSAGSGLGGRAFLKKPFEAGALEMSVQLVIEADERVKAARLTPGPQDRTERILERGRLRLNPDTLQVWVNGEIVSGIRTKCLELLVMLMKNPDGVSRDELLEKVWDGSDDRQIVATTIQRLREDLKPHGQGFIKTLRGVLSIPFPSCVRRTPKRLEN